LSTVRWFAVPEPPSIRLDSVSKVYAAATGEVRAVDNISLEIEPGTSIAVTGPSGCGKSTLLALIGGLEVPSEGQVKVGEHTISSMPRRRRAQIRRTIFGFVFQNDSLLPFLTARENIEQQVALGGRDGQRTDAVRLLAEVGLAEQAEKFPDDLSGGQRQRVAVVRAIGHHPRVLLADEPTGSLDRTSAAALVGLLLGFRRSIGATLVIVTHDPEVARRMDREVILEDGRIGARPRHPQTPQGA
jgi:putative ABC transport system ATP-binding protein